MAGKKTKPGSKLAACPTCEKKLGEQGRAFANDLNLEPSTGNYTCRAGHSFTIEQLREALESAKTTPETAAADRPENGGFAVVGEGGISTPESTQNSTVLEGSEDHIPDPEGAGVTVHKAGQIYPVSEAVLSTYRENEAICSEPGSSHSVDDLHTSKAALLPNGDMIVPLILPENMVGPVTELAQQDGKTVDEWMSDNFLFYIESYFTAPKA